MAKDDGAFLTIGELAQQLGVAQHILRYWETRFPQLRPLQRSGNRRYYRPRDVEIAMQINKLLNEQGFTVRGAQRMLGGKLPDSASADSAEEAVAAPVSAAAEPPEPDAARAPVAAAGHRQGELPIGAPPARAPGQVASSDLALLIARLTVIRQNLVEAIEHG